MSPSRLGAFKICLQIIGDCVREKEPKKVGDGADHSFGFSQEEEEEKSGSEEGEDSSGDEVEPTEEQNSLADHERITDFCRQVLKSLKLKRSQKMFPVTVEKRRYFNCYLRLDLGRQWSQERDQLEDDTLPDLTQDLSSSYYLKDNIVQEIMREMKKVTKIKMNRGAQQFEGHSHKKQES